MIGILLLVLAPGGADKEETVPPGAFTHAAIMAISGGTLNWTLVQPALRNGARICQPLETPHCAAACAASVFQRD